MLVEVIKCRDDVLEFEVFYAKSERAKWGGLPRIETLNKFVSAKSNWDWIGYQKLWQRAFLEVPSRPKQKKRAYVTIISYRKRLLDKENLYGGAKPIRDCLETIGWLWNDSPKWSDLTCWQTLSTVEKTYIRVNYQNTSGRETDLS